MLIAIIALACAALIGFAAHRASLCNVRAVAELMTSGSAHMLWSLLQAMLWNSIPPANPRQRRACPSAWARPSTAAVRCPR
jgi:hypothetical protein